MATATLEPEVQTEAQTKLMTDMGFAALSGPLVGRWNLKRSE